MVLPRQVQQRLEEVEELEAKMRAPDDSEGGTPAEGKPTPETPPEPSPEEGQTPTPSDDATPAEPDESSEPSEPTTPSAKSDESLWEHKYHRLQGKYDAEVPRLHQQIKELNQMVQELRQQQEQLQAQPPKEPDPEPQPERLVTDADIEEYGEGFVDLQRRVAREEFSKDLAALRQENAQLREMLERTGSQIGEMTFNQKLLQAVPDFEEVNADPRWAQWLDEYDPIIRAPRRAVAQDAFNREDAAAVADYVNLFKSQLSANQPKKGANTKRKAEVERQVQPDRASSTSTPRSQTARTYSSKQIESMFKKVAELGAKGRADEAAKLEKEIDSAYREGRVET